MVPDFGLVEQFLGFAWEVCYLYDGSITSGCRSEKRNKDIGSSSDSKHTFTGGWGMAVDIVFDTLADRIDAEEYIAKNKPEYHIYKGPDYEPTRIHLQGWKYGVKPHRSE